MITNMWNKIEIYCDGEAEQQKMTLDERTLTYNCPLCKNQITIREFERLLNVISKKIMDAEMNAEVANLENEKWTEKGIRYKIIEHADIIKVTVFNKGAFKNGK